VTLIGLVNGLLVVTFQVPSFASTLGTLGILQALSLVLTNATNGALPSTSAPRPKAWSTG
jgi:ribose transport system permease protein